MKYTLADESRQHDFGLGSVLCFAAAPLLYGLICIENEVDGLLAHAGTLVQVACLPSLRCRVHTGSEIFRIGPSVALILMLS